MNLVIDIGNTKIKAAAFNGSEMVQTITDERNSSNILDFLRTGNKMYSKCIISSVTEIPKKLKPITRYLETEPVLLDDETPVPFTNLYSTKHTLGKDRIAAIAGACWLYPDKNVLVIDAGTAVTYDFKTENEEYLGGNISPGLTMRFKALNSFTAKLPAVESSDEFGLLGRSTELAIRNGVQNGLIFEINTYIETFGNKYNDFVVILTGGDAHFFENKLKKPIFVVSNLTLIGLNIILQHNAKMF